MAYRRRYQYKTGGPEDGKTEMTIAEFTKFLYTFDTDNDGVISQEELRQAVRNSGGWFATWKAKRGLKSVDLNGNGFIDEDEIPKLAGFAEKELNIKIVSY